MNKKKIFWWLVVLGLMAIIAITWIRGGIMAFRGLEEGRQAARNNITNEFKWVKFGVSFRYPKEYTVIDQGDVLYLSLTPTLPEGESLLLYSRLNLLENTAVEKVIQNYSNEPNFSRTTEELVGNTLVKTFTKVQYTETVTGQFITHYLIPIHNNVLDYSLSSSEDVFAAIVRVIPSLKF